MLHKYFNPNNHERGEPQISIKHFELLIEIIFPKYWKSRKLSHFCYLLYVAVWRILHTHFCVTEKSGVSSTMMMQSLNFDWEIQVQVDNKFLNIKKTLDMSKLYYLYCRFSS